MAELFTNERFPFQVPQLRAEFEALLAMYEARKPAKVLEIGSYWGGTLFEWIERAPDGGLIVSVDTGDWADNYLGSGTSDRLAELWQTWAGDRVTLEIVKGGSADPEVFARVQAISPEYDFCFIDGDHSYSGVKSDWEMYGSLVRPGGLVALHDILDAPENVAQVYRLWDEIRATVNCEELTSYPGQAGCGIGVVYK